MTISSDVKLTDLYQKHTQITLESRKWQERTMAVNDANNSGAVLVLKFELALYILMIWFKHTIFSYRQAHCSNYSLTLVHQHKLCALKQGTIFSFCWHVDSVPRLGGNCYRGILIILSELWFQTVNISLFVCQEGL